MTQITSWAGSPTPAANKSAATLFPVTGPNGKKLYYFLVFNNATPGSDVEFNRWYDRIHAPVMIESGDFVWAQRFAWSPIQMTARGELPMRQYLVIFAIETDDIAKVAADAERRMHLPRNVSSKALDYTTLMSGTFEALGPAVTQKQAVDILAEEQAAGRVAPAGAQGGQGSRTLSHDEPREVRGPQNSAPKK